MNIGKLPPDLLEELVLSKLSRKRSEVLVRSTTGQDSCFISTNNKPIVVSTDPITGDVDQIGWFALHIACNDLAANGAEPIGVLLTLLLPQNSPPEMVRKIMDDATRAADELNIDILGGHTELTDAVNRTVVSTTALGKPVSDTLIVSNAVYGGLDIVLTKGAGIEGTAILANAKKAFLKEKISERLLDNAEKLLWQLSVVPESKVAVTVGVKAMHDVTEGGTLGALYEVVQTGECGFIVDYDCIPILPETKAICEELEIDPLRLISSGSMLIFTEHGTEMVKALAKEGIKSAIIGKTTSQRQYMLKKDGVTLKVDPPESDELWRVLGK